MLKYMPQKANVPNNGSFTWNVPLTFTPGRYTVIAATPGNLFDDPQVVVIGTTAPSPCSPSANSAELSSTPQAMAATTFSSTSAATLSATTGSTEVDSSSSALAAFAALLNLNYTQMLQTTCA